MKQNEKTRQRQQLEFQAVVRVSAKFLVEVSFSVQIRFLCPRVPHQDPEV